MSSMPSDGVVDDELNASVNWLEDDEENSTGKSNEKMMLNPTYVRERIENALTVLADFKNRRNKAASRSDIVATLSRDLSEYYGYLQELSELFLELFSPAECVEFMEASDKPRPLVIRSNTLKTTRKDLMDALSKRGVVVEAIDWSKVAIKVTESTVPIGATPEYLAGHYMLQSAASMNPVMALDPQPGERILDMSSAPGGKTSYIAQLMKNTGTVIANDLKPQRQKATVANLHRMGVKNGIVCCYDGRKISSVIRGFDRVLLDAPCSGLGVIARDQTVKLQRTVKDIQRNSHLQKELLCAAVDAVDPKSPSGGVVVYSTCSVSNEENEQVVQYILQKRYVRLVDTGLQVGKPGLTRYKDRRFHPSLALTRRFYPHVHNMDGFYVAKLVKYANGPRNDVVDEDEDEEVVDEDDDEEAEDGNGDDQMEVEREEEKPLYKGKNIKADVKAGKKKSKGETVTSSARSSIGSSGSSARVDKRKTEEAAVAEVTALRTMKDKAPDVPKPTPNKVGPVTTTTTSTSPMASMTKGKVEKAKKTTDAVRILETDRTEAAERSAAPRPLSLSQPVADKIVQKVLEEEKRQESSSPAAIANTTVKTKVKVEDDTVGAGKRKTPRTISALRDLMKKRKLMK